MRRAALGVMLLSALFGGVIVAQSTAFVQGLMPVVGLLVYGGLVACAAIIGVARLRGSPGSPALVAGSIGGTAAMLVGLALESRWIVIAAVATQALAAAALVARHQPDER